MDENKYDVIDAEYIDNPENLPSVVEIEQGNDQIELEYIYARRNIVTVIEKSIKVLGEAGELAISTDNPHLIEVFADLAKDVIEMNKTIFDVREKKMKLTGEIQPDARPKKVVNNAIFVGSTDELLKKMNLKEE